MDALNDIRDKKVKEAQEVFDCLQITNQFNNQQNLINRQEGKNQATDKKLIWTRLSSSSSHSLIIENA